ncbi:type II CAAX endopeptidase family protein [Bengtsoniella intestinalis]|uniref:CPBP family intramembrane glutamic endopeptidase n=1 Tax=Bengtsoniella intestinalis TaxID=3073143 RepID=UPI00391F714A
MSEVIVRKNVLLALSIVLCIAIIAYVDLVVRPSYWEKTMVKAPLFFLTPLVFAWWQKETPQWRLLRFNPKGLKLGVWLGVGIYIVVVGTYLLVNTVADLSGIQASLEQNLGINGDNFLLVGLYVSVVNSFLEEWFFRGFVFTQWKKTSRQLAYVVSSFSFAIYHIAIMDGMFSVWVVALVLVGLMAGGTIFNYLNEKSETIYASWFCHAFANFAMNTIGFMIF